MVIYNDIIPFNGYKAINLFGLIFARDTLTPIDINHEEIHTAQMKEQLFVFFYILYLVEYIVNIFKYKDLSKAYHNISFEIEAYSNEKNLDYLKNRKHYNNYLK